MEKLTIEHVSYQYPGSRSPVLRDLGGEFLPGEMTAVIGPSGSGKSTLLSLLAGLDRPTEERILLDGEEIGRMDPDRYRRERVSVIFQSFQLLPLLTVQENVCVPRELQGRGRRDAEETARALAGEARLLLADEPTGNLDGENSRSIVALLRKLAGDGCCVVVDGHRGGSRPGL